MALQVTETLLAGQRAIGAANAPIKYGDKLLDKMGIKELVKGRKERLKRFNEFAAKKKTLDINTVPPAQQEAMTKAMIAYGEQYDKATQMIKSGNKASQGYVDAINLTSTLNSGVDSLKTQLDAWGEEGTQLGEDINEGIISKAIGDKGFERGLAYYSDDAELVFQEDADGNVMVPPRTGYKFKYHDPNHATADAEGMVEETIWNGEEKPEWFEPSEKQINQFVAMKEEMDTNIIKGDFDPASGKRALSNYLSGLNHKDAMSFAADFFNGMAKGSPKTSFNNFKPIKVVQKIYEAQFAVGGSREGESASESWWMDKEPIKFTESDGTEKELDAYNALKEGLGKYSDQFVWPEYNKKWEAQQVQKSAVTKIGDYLGGGKTTKIEAEKLAITDKLTQAFLGYNEEGLDPDDYETKLGSLMAKDNDGNPIKVGIIPVGAFNLLKAKQPSGGLELETWMKNVPKMDDGSGSLKIIPYREDIKEYTESELQALYNWTLTNRGDPISLDYLNSIQQQLRPGSDPITVNFNTVGIGDVMFKMVDYGSKITTKTGGDDDITTVSTETGKHMVHELRGDPNTIPTQIGSATFGMIENPSFNSYLDFISQNFATNLISYQSEEGRSLLGGASILGKSPIVK